MYMFIKYGEMKMIRYRLSVAIVSVKEVVIMTTTTVSTNSTWRVNQTFP